ncbi:Endonuclease related to Holliday junction resolvase [Dehalogenimonas formicexedens]|uniref:Endonuclease related to Holliday junction resolvase n=1 Tax=Dehalogenimonas formicexedens TaxID=1839801 RepID=A0A1P8F8D7_9CHLR|nr:Holliday junction resolvase-like protein [Dehalogenimonas formicexedens]APV44739.1 Endonuclease related to Holliday junction resolvase [Dehalogenimonas formicexedens]
MGTALAIAAIVLLAFIVITINYYLIRRRFESRFKQWQAQEQVYWQNEVGRASKQAVIQSRAVLGGKFTEQMTPYLPEFKYDPTEARFIGSPIDFVVFPGLAAGDPKEVVIVEVKSGKNCALTPSEKKIQELIEDGMVRWEIIERRCEPEIDSQEL